MYSSEIQKQDQKAYRKFTGPARLDKAMHLLEGIVSGIAADNKINDAELSSLTAWLSDHREFAKFHPFNEVIPRLDLIIGQNIVDEEQVADMLWLCDKFSSDQFYYDQVSSDMQRLQGLLSGVIADGVITEDELEGLDCWMKEHEHLKSCWPYDELESLIVAVLADGKIDEIEHQQLLDFFGEFSSVTGDKSIDPVVIDSLSAVTGVCAICPDVDFNEKNFCFTGSSNVYTRDELAKIVASLGGRLSKNLTKSVHYLVVCSEGNQCWAYACYGRKVEKAIEMRKAGVPIVLVHETDFHDAIQDLEFNE